MNKSRGTITASWVKLKRGGSRGKRHVMKVAMMWITSVCVFRIYGDGAKSLEVESGNSRCLHQHTLAAPVSGSHSLLSPRQLFVSRSGPVIAQSCAKSTVHSTEHVSDRQTSIRVSSSWIITRMQRYSLSTTIRQRQRVRQTKSVENKDDSDLEVYRHARVPVKIEPCTVPVFNDVLGCFIQIITVDHASFMYLSAAGLKVCCRRTPR